MKQLTMTEKIHALAKTTNHAVLAKQIGIKRSLLRNWIYKDVTPSDFTIQVLSPKVDRLYKRKK